LEKSSRLSGQSQISYDCGGTRAREKQTNEERDMKTLGLKALVLMVAVAFLLGVSPTTATAFWGHRQVVTTNYAMPSVPMTVGYAPVAVGAPVVTASPIISAPVVASYAPTVAAYAAPVTSYYAPATTAYYAPTVVARPAVTSYYAPTATIAAPVTTYYAPAAVAAPVTSYYAPAAVAAPVTSYYAPPVVGSTTVITRRGLLFP
jgi:hypothetical protein